VSEAVDATACCIFDFDRARSRLSYLNSESGILPLPLGRRAKNVIFARLTPPAAAGTSLCLSLNSESGILPLPLGAEQKM
jgi:hypothetical protein